MHVYVHAHVRELRRYSRAAEFWRRRDCKASTDTALPAGARAAVCTRSASAVSRAGCNGQKDACNRIEACCTADGQGYAGYESMGCDALVGCGTILATPRPQLTRPRLRMLVRCWQEEESLHAEGQVRVRGRVTRRRGGAG